jgi:DNA-3-methyladenine glycosylase II
MPRTRPLPYDPKEAADHLRRSDPAMRRLVTRVGAMTLRRPAGGSTYAALAQSIVYQQLHAAAAATIFGRLCALGAGQAEGAPPEPAALLRLPEAALRGAGLSAAKAAAMRDLAQKTVDGAVPTPRALARMEDAAIVARLTAIRGVGRWTAEMMLIFRLGRPDVWPTGDFAVRKGYGLLFGLAEPPSARALEGLGEAFAPFRSAAAWYLWRSLDGS